MPAEPMVRVRIVHTLDEIAALPLGDYVARTSESEVTLTASEKVVVRASGDVVAIVNPDSEEMLFTSSEIRLEPAAPGNQLTLEQVPFGVGWWWESREDRIYEGTLDLSINADKKLMAVLELPVEEYLRGVVPSEIGPTAPEEALKAQAVAARSETMTALSERTYEGPGYDICADVDCQVFSGTNKRNGATDAAIKATRGIIMTYDGKPIPAYYASNCGGYSEDVANVWPGRDRGIPCWSARFDGPGEPPADLTQEANIQEWVTTEPDVYCNPNIYTDLPDWTRKNFRWTVETSAEDLTKLVAEKKDIGRVLRIEPISRGPSGRMIEVRFVGENGEYTVGPELAIRQMWKPPLKSAAFVVETEGPEGRPETFRMIGGGYGHGVGMCQTGAMARAHEGQDFRQILLHYYKDSELITAYE